MNQLILPYQKNIKHTFKNLYSDSNNILIDSVKNIFLDDNNQIYLWGDKNLGKSHILYAACNHFSDIKKKCVYLPLKDYDLFNTDILDGFENYDLVCIDDIDIIYGKSDWEYSFFKMLNNILENSKKIICTSSRSLALENIILKDLHSRLSWGLVFMINQPNDTIKENILNKIIAEKEYNISDDVCSYLLKHNNRKLSDLLDMLHKIGSYSLSNNKKVHVKTLSNIIDF
ncbi:MAG: hypothetical protein HN613_02355 [Gammaproteobacteria bacterium]|jgi:DnaA-homolog protein|nr:hypothetical protein [Gammaproteobacteria bacterium]MBT7603527.1 hypothetical protein [Gammaproteobacteria bacterium]